MNTENLLTVKEVAERREISVWRVYQLINEGTLKAMKLGVQNFITEKDADALVVYGKPGRPPKEKKDSKKNKNR